MIDGHEGSGFKHNGTSREDRRYFTVCVTTSVTWAGAGALTIEFQS